MKLPARSWLSPLVLAVATPVALAVPATEHRAAPDRLSRHDVIVQTEAPRTRSTKPDRDAVRLGGAVRHPQRLSTATLQAFDQRTVTTTYRAAGVPTTRTFTGPLLLDVLNAAEPRFDQGKSNDQLAFAVRVGATDGYRAVVAWGEIDPGFAGTQVLLALTEDGKTLERPRLVVPGDVRGGRYVTDVSTVRLVDLGR